MAVATCIETPTKFARRTIADATSVPIGTLMKLEDANTVVVSAADNDPFGGIAWEEKTTSDGLTEITVALNGVWEITTTAANVAVGHGVCIGAANAIRSIIEADLVLGRYLGKSRGPTLIGAGVVIVEVGSF